MRFVDQLRAEHRREIERYQAAVRLLNAEVQRLKILLAQTGGKGDGRSNAGQKDALCPRHI